PASATPGPHRRGAGCVERKRRWDFQPARRWKGRVMVETSGEGPILLVDDHELLAEGLAAALRVAGHDVVVAHSGATDDEILDLADAHHPRLVLLDLQLDHGRSGLGLIGPLLERDAPALILTGVTDRVELAERLQAGAIGVAPKAQRFDGLLEVVEK